MGATTVSCPECGVAIPVGLPQHADVELVAASSADDGYDDADRRRRQFRCDNGHQVVVYSTA